ncbi:unnamed protein product [Allacma fusca]|uniref:Uncharacterized protein n=1 Tax=Allacma fusca TaxID=39272 RepID=A0A8J2KAT2_9HEXA|nr:unnamed protein product [Allacma fusca]
MSSLLKAGKVLVLFFYFISYVYCQPGCPGPCVSGFQCQHHGGRILGPCGSGQVCCEYGGNSGTCGHIARGNKVSNFKSPDYPTYSSGSLICKFDLELSTSSTGVRLDFLDLVMDSTPVDAKFYDMATPSCDSDMFFIKGFKDWSPDPRCGNLTGYSALVELEPGQPVLTLVFVMSSFAYKWHVRLTEITHAEIQQAGQILDNKVMLSYPPAPQRPFYPGRLSEVTQLSRNKSQSPKRVPLIGGGADATPSSVPWQASLQTIQQMPVGLCGEPKNLSIHFCGGSIIDDRTIVTAAHCFLSAAKYPHPMMDLNLMKIVVGEHNLCHVDEVPHTRSIPVASVIFHFNYLSAEIINDIALVKLANPIQFNPGVQPIALAYPGIQTTGMMPLLSGWGSIGTEENATYPPILQQTSAIEVMSEQDCMKSTVNYLKLNPHNRLSFKYKSGVSRGVCTRGIDTIIEAGFGDSGGPLAVMDKSTSRYYLYGVVSHKRPERDEKAGRSYNLNYFGKIPDYGTWILMGLVPP